MKAEKKTSVDAVDSGAHIMLGTLLDTTWRMFVPVILFTLIGYGIDAGFDTQPAATLTGMAFGIFSSFALVAIQLKRIMKTTNTTKKEQD